MSIHTKFVAFSVAVLCYASFADVRAAEFERATVNGKYPALVLRGPIETGDLEKFVKRVLESPRVGTLLLDSPGGEVQEAMRLGEAVKALRLATRVESPASCASACFIVWVNGAQRVAGAGQYKLGRVGLHRPSYIAPSNSSVSLARQAEAMMTMRKYLEAKFVPHRLIDQMMSRASSEIYWMTNEDLSELGDRPADLDELYIARCGDVNRLLQQEWDKPPGVRNEQRISELERAQRKALDCVVDLELEARFDALSKLKRNWRP